MLYERPLLTYTDCFFACHLAYDSKTTQLSVLVSHALLLSVLREFCTLHVSVQFGNIVHTANDGCNAENKQKKQYKTKQSLTECRLAHSKMITNMT